MARKIRLVVVIPAFNRRHFTACCLERLSRQSCDEFETLVVDDGSTDGTADMVREKFGMNFVNMPELHWHYGYWYSWGLIIGTTILQLWFFRRKHWF